MNEKEFINSQKDCAKMLGESLEEYKKNTDVVKANTTKRSINKKSKLLEELGITDVNLKRIFG